MLAGVNIFTRDADVSAMDTAAPHRVGGGARPTPAKSIWPLVAAVGGVLVVVGLVTYPSCSSSASSSCSAPTVEWMVQAWSERASADPRYNAEVRGRIAHPLELPLLGAVGVGILVYSFSRIMLLLSKTEGPALFAIIAALILLVGFIVAFRPSIRNGAIGAVCSIAAVGLVAGGAAAALEGEREIHPHETTSALAADGECDDADETEADENASQIGRRQGQHHGRAHRSARTAR